MKSGMVRIVRPSSSVARTKPGARIAVLAEALWLFAALAVVLLVIRFGVIAREERYLERKFGREYLDYKATARRWI